MTTPKDDLSEFSNAWNELRNAIMGRGTEKPANVPLELYTKTGNAYERWRKYLAALPADMQILPIKALSDWVLEYRELADEATELGLKFPAFAPGWIETARSVQTAIKKAADNAGAATGGLLIASLFLAAIPVIALMVGGKRRA
jgi:hypothetical protein